MLASPLLVGSAIPGGTVTDPQGDAIGGGPDIASFSVCYTATDLQLSVDLFTPWDNDTAVVFDLNVDQDPNTGTQGFEFLVSAIGQQRAATVFNIGESYVTGVGTATYGASSVMVRVPLSAIGGDDGVLDALAQVGARSGSVITISDLTPDAGGLTSVACAGSVVTSTTLPTTTTTLPAGRCTSDSECDDGNPCTRVQCAGGQCVNHPLGGGAGAECEVAQAAAAVCSAKLQSTITQKLAKARAAIGRAATATTAKKKAKAKTAASAAVRAIARKVAKFAAKGKISVACAQQIADAMQRLLQAIDAI
jgi:hypothetical protein